MRDLAAGTVTSGAELHARATALAHRAMDAAAASTTPFADTDYGRAQAGYVKRLHEMRDAGRARHAAHNQELHEQAEIRRHGGFQRGFAFQDA